MKFLNPKSGGTDREWQQECLNNAVFNLEEAIRHDPYYSAGYVNLAIAHVLANDHHSAIGLMNNLEKIRPLTGNGHLIRGIAWEMDSQIDSARQDFKQAEALDAYRIEYNYDLFKKRYNWSISSIVEWIRSFWA